MIVDRRKDHYDELLVLARDARLSRARTNRWTTGLIVAGMAASTAYVAATNNQVAELRQAKDAAEAKVEQLNVDLGRLQIDHEGLRVERDIYKENAEWFAEMSPSLNVASRLGDIANALDGRSPGDDEPRDHEPGATVVRAADFALSNLVWYVDGSRRFPMAANDVLWIPEGGFWVQLEDPGSPDVLPTHILVYDGARPPATVPPPTEPRRRYRLDGDRFYLRDVRREGANCVKLELDNRTQRPGFGAGYVDMVVTYTNISPCELEDE
jgi:hypothetical protein